MEGDVDGEIGEMLEIVDNEMDIDEDIPPLQRAGHVAVKYNKQMLVWGGYYQAAHFMTNTVKTEYRPTTTIWLYDPLLEQWTCQNTKEENAPPGTSGACGLIFGNSLYIFGGYYEDTLNEVGKTSNEIYSLNLRSLEWLKYECTGDRPLACDKMVGWVHNERLYFFGGFGMPPRYSNSYKTSYCEFVFDEEVYMESLQRGWNNQLVIFDPRARKWIWPSFRGPPPLPRAAHAAAKIGNKVYVFGGRHKSVRMNDFHCLDLDTMVWSGRITMKGMLPKGRSWHSFTPISEKFVVLFGGFCQQQEALSDCWILNLETLSWNEVQLPCNKARLWHSACPGDQGEILIFGGFGGNALDPINLSEEDYLISLWFSPKSLQRLSLEVIMNHNKLNPLWCTLPLALQEVLRIKSLNQRHRSKSGI